MVKFSFEEKIGIVFLIFVILFFGVFGVFGCITIGDPTDGVAVDSVARVSYGGLLWKTWRVELTNDHPISDGSGGENVQRYGVANDEKLINKLKSYAESVDKVKIYYHGNFIIYDWEYSSPDVIYKVEPIGNVSG